MPTPFLNRQKNTSTGSKTYDNPKTVGYDYPGETAPVPEHVAGVNNAYRGLENHGVAPTEDWSDVFTPDEDADLAIPQVDPPLEVVPVRIVSEASNEKRLWRVNRMYTSASGNPVRLVGAMHNRTNLRIANVGTVTVWYGYDQNSALKINGHPLAANAEVEFVNSIRDGEVWAVSDDGTQQPLSVKYEFNTE